MITMESAMNTVPQVSENSYKMTEEDVMRLIEFRASNEALFTGKRNAAKIAWNTILKGLGLQGKLTADQIAKKWDNLRTKYKDLKQPYQGQDTVGTSVDSWRWYHIMDEAMQGRLYNSSLLLSPESAGGNNNNNHHHHHHHHPVTSCTSNGSQGAQNSENTDILEFLIKTEMEDSVGAEAAEEDGRSRGQAAHVEGIPMGWRRMSECTYKMTEPETERMIKLRAANEALFTGRKHTAKPAWRAILFELGLQGKLTTDQLAKKWDNLKRRYKELKFPARGTETNPNSWPWFYRMNDAMEGRFATCAPVLTPIVEDGDEECEPSPSPPRKRARQSTGRGGMSEFLTESEMDLLVENEDRNGTALGDFHRMTEFSYKLTEEDTRRLIELRAANESLFTGRRNTAKPAWRGIVKEMGLTGKITPDQVAKKWDNLKTKFKDLKFPPRGMENQTNPASWSWFQLMSDAMEGRLTGKAPRVTPLWMNEEDNNLFGSSPPRAAERDGGAMAERSSMSELDESLGAGDSGDGAVTYIDASGEECSTPTDLSYKMTDQDTRKLIKLRAANGSLFTGKRNAAKAAWKAILKELGLLGKVSTYQISKKWDNLKRRYKDLKYPPVGMESMADNAASWSWYHLMNEAMEGRLASSAPVLTPITQEDELHPDPPGRHGRERQAAQDRAGLLANAATPSGTTPSSDYGNADAYAVADGVVDECQRATAECDRALQEERLLGRGGGALQEERLLGRGGALQEERLLGRGGGALQEERLLGRGGALQEERLLGRGGGALQEERLLGRGGGALQEERLLGRGGALQEERLLGRGGALQEERLLGRGGGALQEERLLGRGGALQEERLLGRGGATSSHRGLEREWEMVGMERAAVDRDRAAVQAERVWLERERAALERDRAMIEQERAALGREREVLDSERAMMMNTVTVVHAGHMNGMGM